MGVRADGLRLIIGSNTDITEKDGLALRKGLAVGFRTLVQRQHGEIVAARDEVKALQAVG